MVAQNLRKRTLDSALLLLASVITTSPASGQTPPAEQRIGLDASHEVIVTANGEPEDREEVRLWVRQSPEGYLSLPEQAPPEPARSLDVRVRVVSASTGRPIPGALAFLAADFSPIPLFDVSNLQASAEGTLRASVPEGARVRIWAAQHEVLELSARALVDSSEVVLQPGGQGQVLFTFQGQPQGGVELEYRTVTPGDTKRPWLVAQSDREGRFRIDGLGTGRELELRVTDPRFAFTALDAGPGVHELPMQAGTEATGIVQDPEGRPLSGVAASALIPVPGESPRLWRRRTETDEAGIYRLQGLPATRVLLSWEAEGRMSERRWADLTASGSGAQKPVILAPGLSRTVVVTGEEGQPLVAVILDPATQQRWTTERAGRATVDGLAADRETVLQVEADGHLPDEVVVSPRAASPLEVRLRRGRGVRFELRDLLSGDPVANLRSETRHGTKVVFDEQVAPDGRYSLSGFVPGPVRLSLEPPGYRPIDLELPPGDGIEDLGVLLADPGTVVEGHLLDETGAPLVGAAVSAAPIHRWGTRAAEFLQGRHAVTTDSTGWFRLTGLDGGEACLQIEHPHRPGAALELESLDPGEQRQLGPTIVPLPGSVSGWLIDDEDQPVAGLAVELRLGPLHSACRRLTARSGNGGEFRFAGVGPGRWSAVALRDQQIEAVREVVVGEGDDVDEVVLRLVERIVQGRVALGRDEPPAGHVEIRPLGDGADFAPPALMIKTVGVGAPSKGRFVSDVPQHLVAPVGEQGTFTARGRLDSGLAALEYHPRGTQDTYRQQVEVPPGDGPLNIDLRFDGVAVRGWLLDESGAPLADALVELGATDVVLRGTRSLADGSFRLPHVPSGSWTVTAKAGELRGEASVVVAGEDVDDLEVEARRDRPARLRMTIVSEDGRPVYGAYAYLTNGKIHRFQRSGAGGEAVFSALPGGEYSVAVRSPSGGLQSGESLRLETGRTADVRIELAEASRVLVRLPEETTGSQVALTTGEGLPLAPLLGMTGRRLLVGPGGELSLPSLAEGVWLLTLPDQASPLRLDVERGDTVVDLR